MLGLNQALGGARSLWRSYATRSNCGHVVYLRPTLVFLFNRPGENSFGTSGSAEGVMGDHDSYSDRFQVLPFDQAAQGERLSTLPCSLQNAFVLRRLEA